MTEEKVFFSIIVPVYRVEAYLDRCIESVLAQTHGDFELILVEDGSDDRSLRICRKYLKQDERVRLICHGKNCGLVTSRKDGLLAARGTYIIHVDGDDRIREDMLEKAREAVERDGSPELVVFRACREWDDRTEVMDLKLAAGYYDRERIRRELIPWLIWDPGQPFCDGKLPRAAWAKAYRRDFLLRHYCRDEKVSFGEDAAFVYECGLYARSMTVVPEAVYFYNRQNAASMTRQFDSRNLEEVQRMLRYIRGRIGGKNRSIDRQIDAMKAWYLMRIVYAESGTRPLREAASVIEETICGSFLVNIRLNGLPFLVRTYCYLIRSGIILPVVFATKLRLMLQKEH